MAGVSRCLVSGGIKLNRVTVGVRFLESLGTGLLDSLLIPSPSAILTTSGNKPGVMFILGPVRDESSPPFNWLLSSDELGEILLEKLQIFIFVFTILPTNCHGDDFLARRWCSITTQGAEFCQAEVAVFQYWSLASQVTV